MLCCATLANTAFLSSLKPRAEARATPYPTWFDAFHENPISFLLEAGTNCELTRAAVTAVVTAACEVVGSRWSTPVEFKLSIAWLRKKGTLVFRTWR